MTNDTYPAGQCTRYVADHWSAQVGPYWGDGWMWLGSAIESGYATTATPTVGSIAVWGQNVGGARDAGHVAIVTNTAPLTVSESNWNVPLQPDVRIVAPASEAGIGGYILPTGADGRMDLDTARSIVHVTLAMQGLLANQTQVDAYASQMVPPFNPEAGLTALENDIKADMRSAWNRLAAVEAKVTPPAPAS